MYFKNVGRPFAPSSVSPTATQTSALTPSGFTGGKRVGSMARTKARADLNEIVPRFAGCASAFSASSAAVR